MHASACRLFAFFANNLQCTRRKAKQVGLKLGDSLMFDVRCLLCGVRQNLSPNLSLRPTSISGLPRYHLAHWLFAKLGQAPTGISELRRFHLAHWLFAKSAQAPTGISDMRRFHLAHWFGAVLYV